MDFENNKNIEKSSYLLEKRHVKVTFVPVSAITLDDENINSGTKSFLYGSTVQQNISINNKKE